MLLYSAARRAAPIYHSPPENATRSRVPRLNAPMGTPRPHVPRHVSGRAPRRGRRPRRPASAHHRIPVYSRLILRRGGVLPRPPPIFCFHMYASGGHISFNSERNMEKNAAKNQRFLDFPCPIPTTVQKGSASNRLYPHPRCRSHAPRGDAPVCYRAAGLLRPYRRFPEYRRTQIDAPRRGRRPRRPAHVSAMSPAGRVPRCAGAFPAPR